MIAASAAGAGPVRRARRAPGGDARCRFVFLLAAGGLLWAWRTGASRTSPMKTASRGFSCSAFAAHHRQADPGAAADGRRAALGGHRRPRWAHEAEPMPVEDARRLLGVADASLRKSAPPTAA
jgi:hypothetical protein